MREETKKKSLALLSLCLTIAFAIALGWGIMQYRSLQQTKIEAENQYKRALNDLVTDLDEIETSMAKAKLANSTTQKVLYFGETWKGSDSAVNKFGQLPADEVGISYVDTLINQVGDFSKSMTKKIASGQIMTAAEWKIFNDMQGEVIDVHRAVQNVANSFYAENLNWVDKAPGLLNKIGLGKNLQTAAQGGESSQEQNKGNSQEGALPSEQTPTSVRGGLKQLDASLQKYPPFTYQGDLDKHFVEKPLGLPAREIDEKRAVAVAASFLSKIGYTGAAPKVTGLSQEPMGGFNLTYKDAYIEVSKKGGVVTYFRDQRMIEERRVDTAKANDHTLATLTKLGWDVIISSTQDFGSYLEIDAVPRENGVKLYPDKVRLTVALDNAELTGFDANPYYAYHHDRKLQKRLNLEQAKAKLNDNFKVLENSMAVISQQGNQEAFCYEFRGTAFGEEYLVYINAENGSEEKISRVVNTPRGKLIQ